MGKIWAEVTRPLAVVTYAVAAGIRLCRSHGVAV